MKYFLIELKCYVGAFKPTIAHVLEVARSAYLRGLATIFGKCQPFATAEPTFEPNGMSMPVKG